MYASVGKVAILKENMATSQAFYNMVISEIETRNYIYQYLKMIEAKDKWTKYISTGTQSNLNAEKVKKLSIIIPNEINEKDKIGRLFIKIDSLITLHQRKLIYIRRYNNEEKRKKYII